MYRADTIAACATAPGRSAVAVIRASGPDVPEIADRIFRPSRPGDWEAARLRLGTVIAADGVTALDQALAVLFPAPHSYTGEDVLELHCHGSPVVVEQVLETLLSLGARAAERGEFTRRAVLRGRMDLLQAEAVADLIDARVAAGARAAWGQLQGALSSSLAALRERLVRVLAILEAQVDFTDDELPEPDLEAVGRALADVEASLREMLDGFAAARRQREGTRVVFTGEPNAGKSSLVNALLGSGRMIVSSEPGTTRDLVEETVDLGGCAFVLVDSAGIRKTGSPAEGEAIVRARRALEEADLKVLVLDASREPGAGFASLWDGLGGGETIVALNKADLPRGLPEALVRELEAGAREVVETRACEEGGASALEQALRRWGGAQESGVAGISRARHRAALERALAPLARARSCAAREDSWEIAAFELRCALVELSGITEALGEEEVLDRIFSEFCIGK